MSTDAPIMSEEELDRLSKIGRAIYDEKLKPVLEPEYNGQFVAIHLDTGDYEVAKTSPKARFALRDRHPEGMIMTTNIGPVKDEQLVHRILASQLLAGQQK
jgi:hypothetical protein